MKQCKRHECKNTISDDAHWRTVFCSNHCKDVDWKHSLKGMLSKRYSSMKFRTQGKTTRKCYTDLPLLSFEEFSDWSLNDPSSGYVKCHEDWVACGKKKSMTPSIDRYPDKSYGKDAAGYTKGNMRWLPAGKHSSIDNIKGAVFGLDPGTKEVVVEFDHAYDPRAIELGYDPSSIIKCSTGKRIKHKGLLWKRKSINN